MGRRKRVSPITFEALVLEKGPSSGEELVTFVEAEIRVADTTFRGSLFKSAAEQDQARLHRLRLGRLLFWLKNGSAPLGITEGDQELYRLLTAKRAGGLNDQTIGMPSGPAIARARREARAQ